VTPRLLDGHVEELRAFADERPLVLGGPGVTADIAVRAGAWHLDTDLVAASDALSDRLVGAATLAR
jgi:hypothetical protein